MARKVEEIEQDIRALDPADKERLLEVLLDKVDGPRDPGVERAWLEEIERRSREVDEGIVTLIPADEVSARVRASLRRR